MSPDTLITAYRAQIRRVYGTARALNVRIEVADGHVHFWTPGMDRKGPGIVYAWEQAEENLRNLTGYLAPYEYRERGSLGLTGNIIKKYWRKKRKSRVRRDARRIKLSVYSGSTQGDS